VKGHPTPGYNLRGATSAPRFRLQTKRWRTGKIEPLVKLLTEAMQTGVREQFKHVIARKKFGKDDVSAGREYVKGYVEFVHYVERIYEAAKNPAEGHYPESQGAGAHKE
jgi:hypothetical protein